MNGRAGTDDRRGKAKDRRVRRQWMLDTFGDGTTAPCFWCGYALDAKILEVDRYPICGHDGGRYTRDNIVPACRVCNASRCSTCGTEFERLPMYAEH